MPIDIFVIMTGKEQGLIKGESMDKAFTGKGAIEIQSFTFGFSNPRTIGLEKPKVKLF